MTMMLGAEPNVVNEESIVEMFMGGKESWARSLPGHEQDSWLPESLHGACSIE